MQIVKSVAGMQRLAGGWQRRGVEIGFVPTMGCLHDGHLRLVECVRQVVGMKGKIVVSIYVNPTQFGPKEDFFKYPRNLKRDLKLLRKFKVDAVFTPTNAEMYGENGMVDEPRTRTAAREVASGAPFSTYVVEAELSRTMEGASRTAHFRGVTTVVAKLFNIVRPDVAVFGQKDFQQAAIIKRMVADLNFPLKVMVAPTVRDPDGLAMSSRNQYLAEDLRRQATVLWRAIRQAQAAVKKKKLVPAAKLKSDLKKLIETEPDARLDYVEFFKPDTLAPVAKVARGVQMALAVFIGKTRLIDNARL